MRYRTANSITSIFNSLISGVKYCVLVCYYTFHFTFLEDPSKGIINLFVDSDNDVKPLPDTKYESAKVVHISDGDTLTLKLKNKHTIKVRLHGIDCPELNQPGGRQAKSFLRRKVWLKPIKYFHMGTDVHGRNLAIIYCANQSINEALLVEGHAWHDYRHAPNNLNYKSLERIARSRHIGIWNHENPVEPWAWRKMSTKVSNLYARNP